MRTFFHTYKNKYPNTEYFREVAEKVTGIYFTWFLDQWVYVTDIPFYSCICLSEKSPEEKYKTKFNIVQSNNEADFKMSLPIKINFGKDNFVRFRLMITGKGGIIDLPSFDIKPTKIILMT